MNYGGLVETCIFMKTCPPDNAGYDEMEKACARLAALDFNEEFELRRHLCSLAQDDLRWLSTQQVLGPWSYVMIDAEDRRVKTICRPVAWHT